MSTTRHPLPGLVRRALHRKSTWLIGVPVLLLAFAAVGGYAYNRHLNANTPPPLAFSDAVVPVPTMQPSGAAQAGTSAAPRAAAPRTGTSPKQAPAGAVVTSPQAASKPAAGTKRPATKPAAASPIEGTWKVASGSVAGYRIGYSTPVGGGTRVGRTSSVTGEMRIDGTAVRSARFNVDMRAVTSDGGSTCDEHVREIMDVTNHPFETLALASPIQLGSVPADGKAVTVKVTGSVTLRGVTRSETFPLSARRNGDRIEVLGSVAVNRDDYKIPGSGEPGFDIDKDGTIEVLLVLTRTR